MNSLNLSIRFSITNRDFVDRIESSSIKLSLSLRRYSFHSRRRALRLNSGTRNNQWPLQAMYTVALHENWSCTKSSTDTI